MKILYYIGWLLGRILGLVCGMKRRGQRNIPRHSAFILASNHQSNLDPLLLGSWIRRQVYFFAKKELWNNRFFGWIISRTNAFPVNRQALDRQAMQHVKKVLANGYGLVFFPEGTRGNGIKLQPGKPGLGLVLKQSKQIVPIVPVYLHSTKWLLDCLLRKRGLAMVIGQPIPATEVANYLTNKQGYQALADRVMQEIQTLKNENGY